MSNSLAYRQIDLLIYYSLISTFRHNSSNCESSSCPGASNMTSRPELFFGNAIQSRIESKPANKDTQSSRPDHSANALTLIAHAQVWHSLVQTSPEIPAMTCTRHITYYTETAVIPEQISIPHFHLRGPPVKTL